ncbi:TorF family putative porin [Rhizorhabdus argentea]|uniref:TorF family putative porin n=1 Tax=Rhizorhabdus argentea TaxID=1387174 RepID=UPI0030ED05C4
MRGHITSLLAAAIALMPVAARAETSAEAETEARTKATESAAPIAISYNLAIVSDYRFRGLSLTNRDPAVQGGVDVVFSSGFFAGTWASNIADYGGSKIEIDVYAGYGGELAGLSYSAGAYAYLYPGGNDVNYVELQSTLAKTVGPLTTTLTLAYTPDQSNTTRDNFYAGLGADVAVGSLPLTASFAVGRENGGYDEKWDWSAGLTWKLDLLEISASYVDSNYKGELEAGHNGGAGAVLSVKATF